MFCNTGNVDVTINAAVSRSKRLLKITLVLIRSIEVGEHTGLYWKLFYKYLSSIF